MQAGRQHPGAEINELYQRYTAYIDGSPATIRAYTESVKLFLRYLKKNEIQTPTRDTIISYREELKTRCRASTVQNYIEAIKLFFRWTAHAGLYPNIADHVKGAKISQEHKKDYLTSRQAKATLESIDRSTEKGKRDYAIFLLALTGGLRVIELQRANIEDLGKAGNEEVLYIQGKGKNEKSDYVKIPPETEKALRDYIKSKGTPDGSRALFTSTSNNRNGQRLTVRSISGIIKQHLKNAGYNSERITAHSLRHSAVTIALLAGNSLQEVQQFARHKNITTTQIYAHNIEREKNMCERSIAESIFN